MQENLRDRRIKEIFLENFIIKVSNILILVIGIITFSDQLMIKKIKEESIRYNKRTITIIHNLQEFSLKEQVDNYIEEILLKCSTFNLKKRVLTNTEKL